MLNSGKIGAIICVGVMVLALGLPTRSYAGNKEWATAGKILTGVVAAHVLVNGFPVQVGRRPTVVQRTIIREYRTPNCRVEQYSSRYSIPRSRYHRSSYYESRGRRHQPKRHYSGRRPKDGGSHQPKHHYSGRRPKDGGVTIWVSGNKRVYQPRVKGHDAFVQKRSFSGHPWVSVKKHPSIW